MQNLKATQMLAIIAGLSAMSDAGGNAALLTRGFGYEQPPMVPRRSAFRQGRRWSSLPYRKGGNPAGTKLAKKAAKGTLTIIGIR